MKSSNDKQSVACRLLPALALLAACQLPQEPPGKGDKIRGSRELLEKLQPADIAVAPIRNQTGDPSLPSADLRRGFAQALVGRLYSPLDLSYVDANWVEASFGGTPAPDALLVVAVTKWDPSHLYSTGEVYSTAEMFLFEGGSTTGTPLWGITYQAKASLGDGHGNPPLPSPDLVPRAARILAAEFLSTLPERDAVAAHP